MAAQSRIGRKTEKPAFAVTYVTPGGGDAGPGPFELRDPLPPWPTGRAGFHLKSLSRVYTMFFLSVSRFLRP